MNTSPLNVAESFRSELRKSGLEFDGEIIADGKLHRFKASGDREKNSWYVLHSGSPAAGAYGCWKRGVKETFCERNGELSQTELNDVRCRWQKAERERERAETERHTKARKIAAWILSHSKPVTTHAYLEHKDVKNFGNLREFRGALVLPLRDLNGELHSLQFIGIDGSKKFLTGGKIAGCFFTISDKSDGALVITEGYATAASIHEATGLATVSAMNCGNLLAVAKTLRDKFPAREIIVAADNDVWTDGNPGLTKATEAAKAIGAKLGVPHFKDVTAKPTDFNDMATLAGLSEVKRQIEAAAPVKETDDEILQRLATLPPLEFDRCVEKAAKEMGVTVGTLRNEVAKLRPRQGNAELQGRGVDLPDVEPWPEPVHGADVLSEVAECFSRKVALPDGATDVLALYAAHAHAFECFICSPRLNISSPEKGCGKTTLRDVLALLVPRPLPTENLSTAVLFRVTELHKPTLLADECDAWLRDNEELRGMLNSGHRKGGQALRCIGDNNEVRAFQVYTPAVLCGIGSLPGTLHDRSIEIRLQRAKPGEVRERFDSRHVEKEKELCRKLARFVADNKERFEKCDPEMPYGCFNRLADNWRPLFAIAEIAGGNWPQRVRAAFAMLTDKTDILAQGIGTTLLADIREIFVTKGEGKLSSAEIVKELAEIEGREWAEFGKSRKPISVNQLARLLRPFKISPRSVKFSDGNTAKGYHLEMFDEAFERYLPPSPIPTCNLVTMPENIGDSVFSETSPVKDGLRAENSEIANKNNEGDAVTVPNKGKPESEEMLL